jgi:hypothetical protein
MYEVWTHETCDYCRRSLLAAQVGAGLPHGVILSLPWKVLYFNMTRFLLCTSGLAEHGREDSVTLLPCRQSFSRAAGDDITSVPR